MKSKEGFLLLLLSAILLVISGCSSKEDLVASNITINISVKEEFDVDNRLKFSGTTNLPNDMELILSVSGEEGYSSQTKVYITNGLFESEWFTNKGEGLSPGSYNLRLSSPTANVQPESVQDLIGEQGANLTGEYVVSNDTWGNMIEYTYAFHAGSFTSSSTDEDEEIWETVDEFLASGQYALVRDFIDQIPNPSYDLQMMHHLAMYHIYGQGGETEKSFESLYSIPSSYSGRNEDLIAYEKSLYTDIIDSKDSKEDSDFNIYGEYQPVESMTPEEIQAELEAILKESIPDN
ncbi:hypothetical protein ABER99_21340 [Paenibacillus glucanolyticus]|uniref:hypothetical protein n=1 Tax=Paenibacillus glucanolyticus TaxID=59843 RepID=UPI0013E3CBEF|nr:hypothetical protein [Paenibacillus glucanolyticus]